MQALIFLHHIATYSLILLHSLYFENMFQEYACTGVGWGVRPKRIFKYMGGWGVQKWSFWGVRTLWMASILAVLEDSTRSDGLVLRGLLFLK